MAKYSNGKEDSLDLPLSSVIVLESRYLARDSEGNIIETGEELLRRVAKDIAVAELLHLPEFREMAKELSNEELYELAKESSEVKRIEDEFFNLMAKGYFLPNSPTLMNAGRKLQQLSACFVLPVGDSMEEIFDALKYMAIVHKTGGGTGFAFSRLRPNGAFINSTQGYSPGPLSFLFGFNESAGQITQGGKRRGANMGILRANHPDALCWARVKSEEGTLSNFNLSVAFSDEEMEEVKTDGYILMRDPRENKEYTIENARNRVMEIHFGKGDIFKTSWKLSEDETKIIDVYTKEEIGKVEENLIYIKARKLFGTIVEGAWKKGEPGIVFIDGMNKDNPTPEVGMIESTNPCVAEGTLVNTPFGYQPVEELKQDDLVSTVFGEEPISKIEINEDIPVFKIKFSDGGEQKVTAAHRYFAVKKGSHSKNLKDFRVDELEIGDYVRVEPSINKQNAPEKYFYGLKRGILLGDGCYTENCVDKNFIKIASNSEEGDYNSCLKNLFSDFNFRKDDFSLNSKSMSMIISNGKDVLSQMNLTPAYSYEKTFDITCVNTFDEALGILDGLLATDGDVLLKSNHPQIRFTTSSQKLAQNIRRLLLMIGCHGRINQSFFDDGGVINGRKITRKNFRYSIVVSGNSAGVYAKISRLKEINKVKGEKLKNLVKNWLTTGNTLKAKIVSIEPAGTTRVYDLSCENSDTWITEGYVQRGCGEQPLLPYESCNLGSIDLSKMVEEDGELNEIRLEETIRKAVRFLDNVVDRNKYSLKEIERITKSNRKIGLGVMGFAHLLIKLGISYNSSKAVEMAEKVMKFISDVSKDESKKLAKERGAFPNFHKSVYREGELMRNATTTTIAPTGTIGVIASTSQGIEPIFRLITLRNVKSTIGKNLIEVDRAFKDYLKKRNLYDEELIINIEKKGLKLEDVEEFKEIREEMKRLFVTAHEVLPEQHIKIQAAFQKYTDNAVSKTINMPNKSTIEDIAQAYFMAHELGCKGMTVYRDGSRDIQLLTSLKKEEKKMETPFPIKRPSLIGTTIKQQTPHGKAFITLNCIQNSPLKPYEAFINIGKGGKDIPAIAEGFGRLLSLALQTGVPLDSILSQLEDISGETQTGFGPQKIFSLPDAIAKGLKEAVSQLKIKEIGGKLPKEEIEDIEIEIIEGEIEGRGERKISGNFCPECGGVLMFIEGCQKCNCGYSKC